MPSGQPARRRAAKNAHRLITAITAVIALVVTAIPAVATQCKPNVPCIGTRRADKLYGTEGGDRIFGRAGADDVFGRRGRDRVNGGKGADHLDGGAGEDHVRGKGGDDVVIAGHEPYPSDGHTFDYLYGGAGDDELRSDGNGEVFDNFYGGAGDDELRSDGDDDDMEGGPGDDTLYGAGYSQGLEGGLGDDRMLGKNAIDFYSLDSVRAPDWWGHDVIVDGEEEPNWLDLPHSVKVNPPDIRVNLVASPNRPEVKVIGGGGTVNWKGNTIRQVGGGWGDDTILGNAERNRIFLGFGKDTVFARAGNDHIVNHEKDNEHDSDTINCGPGYDRVFAEAEDDAAANCEYVFTGLK